MQTTYFRTLSIFLSITAALLLFMSFRLSQRGKWMPENLPVEIGSWYASDMPLSKYTLDQLGNPPAEGRRYTNLFSERVDVQVIATSSYDAYLEPLILFAGYGYNLTAEKNMDFLGKPGKVRANILQSSRDGWRLIVYQWVQFEDGTVVPPDSVRKISDIFQRSKLGANAILSGKQSCIVRVSTQIHPADTNGLQSRRNIEEVGKALYESLRKQGNAAAQKPETIVGPVVSEEGLETGGQDVAFLNSPTVTEMPEKQRRNLLPLATGNTWEFFSLVNYTTEKSNDRLVVLGPRTEADITGIQVDVLREGKKWRREFYSQKGETTYLVAMQDETSPLMRLHPPVPMWKEPVTEGDTVRWIGEFRIKTVQMGEQVLPAEGYSRISGVETVKTAAGEFKVYRVDTVIVANNGGKELRFPVVRWLAPNVGFVRRGLVDKGRAAFSDLTRFDVQ
jgi:hypothetical protein